MPDTDPFAQVTAAFGPLLEALRAAVGHCTGLEDDLPRGVEGIFEEAYDTARKWAALMASAPEYAGSEAVTAARTTAEQDNG